MQETTYLFARTQKTVSSVLQTHLGSSSLPVYRLASRSKAVRHPHPRASLVPLTSVPALPCVPQSRPAGGDPCPASLAQSLCLIVPRDAPSKNNATSQFDGIGWLAQPACQILMFAGCGAVLTPDHVLPQRVEGLSQHFSDFKVLMK